MKKIKAAVGLPLLIMKVSCFLFEQQLCELVEAAAPGLPLVGCLRRDVTVGVDADGLQVLSHLAYTVLSLGHTCLLATGTHEEHLVGLLEVRHVCQFISTDGATTEDAHIGEGGGIVQCDAVGLQ